MGARTVLALLALHPVSFSYLHYVYLRYVNFKVKVRFRSCIENAAVCVLDQTISTFFFFFFLFPKVDFNVSCLFPSGSERRRSPSPPAASCLQLLHAFLKINFIKNKQVTGHSYVKFYDLQLLFGTFFDISCRSRDISEKPFSGVVFCKIRGEPGVFGSCIFHHRF